MSIELLLSELRDRDIRLTVDGDQLRCNAPRGRLTKELGSRIAAHKSDLIQALTSTRTQIPLVPRESDATVQAPLSFAQERFWFLQNLDPETAVYNVTACQRWLTSVDERRLDQAIHAVVRKHEALRTSFNETTSSPVQVVRADLYPDLAIHDLRNIEAEQRQTRAQSIMEELAKKTFNLATDSLLRVALIRLTDEDHYVVVSMHHIICDAWSVGILLNELKSCYASAMQQCAPLPLQYADYAVWERDRYVSGALEPSIAYWKAKLKDAPPFLDLPVDRSRPPVLNYQGRLHKFELDVVTSESLKQWARQEGVTLFVALLTVFKALLARYSRQNDILVGTPVSNRGMAGLDQLIGCFINTHVLRTDIAQGTSSRDLIARVRSTVIESLSHADVPFEKLVTELVTERDASRSPLFQVAFILQNTPSSSEFTIVSGGTMFDMTLYVWEDSGRLGGCVEYNGALFEPETIARFAECYATLAAQMSGAPDTAIERLSVVTAAQEMEWWGKQEGESVAIPPICTHEWIELQTNRTPDAAAVIAGDERLTFREISERSNRLAHCLRDLGVGRGSLVALCLNRTADLVIAPLAVWKAGAAYIPLDPEFPANRLRFMLEDSAAAVVVTESTLLDRLPADLPALFCLDRDRALLESGISQIPEPATQHDDLAYVLYTSGSTGKPKGVEITHGALVNFLVSMQQTPGLTPKDRLLAVTTFSFDIAGLELYLPLVTGAQVVIASRATTIDGEALAELLVAHDITTMQATPATWRLLLESGWRGRPDMKILCGGEALAQELAERLLATGAELWNLYGPTETTIWSTLQRLVPGSVPIPIGRPIANTQVHLLDEHGLPTPPGVAGELYIGGAGLARGYLRRDELTAARFVTSAFHGGCRLYRTGDLVRRLPGGDLEYRGRVDHQVKVRGFRIELGEIESALEQQDGISQAVVIVREDIPGDPKLTAYVKSDGHHSAEWRAALLSVLPEYMVPAFFIPVDEFPLTPNRKVDRKSLMGPDYHPARHGVAATIESAAQENLSDSRSTYVAPSNNVELLMSEIWREVLNVEQVGVLDNFFALGGHSLSAARLISRIRSTMEMDLPLRCIFVHPTIASLTQHISYDVTLRRYCYTSELPKWSCLVPVQPRGSRTPLFFIAGYQNPDETLLEMSQLIPHLGLDQPLFGFRPRWIEGNASYATVEEMAREFLVELRAVQPKGPYMLGGHCVGGIAALEVAQLLIEEGEQVILMALLDTERPTAWRSFLTDLYFLQRRAKHIAEVFAGIVRAGWWEKRMIVRKLIHRKLKGPDQFYESKVGYRRMLYSHIPKHYPGRITLIVNEEQALIDKELGWVGAANGGLEIHTVPGNHLNVMHNHAREVAQVISNCIATVLTSCVPEKSAELESVSVR